MNSINADWTFDEREQLLNDYVDGLLSGAALAEFEHRLTKDEELRADVAALRHLLSETATLPVAIDPPSHLWEGIEARLEARRTSGNVARFPTRRPPFWTGLSAFAAAAAVTLVAGVAYLNQTPVEPPAVAPRVAEVPEPQPADTEPTPEAMLVEEWRMAQQKADEAYDTARAGLLDALAARPEQLSPEAELALRETQAVIDNAVHELNLALADDPQNPALLHMLMATREKELNLLEQLVSSPQGL